MHTQELSRPMEKNRHFPLAPFRTGDPKKLRPKPLVVGSPVPLSEPSAVIQRGDHLSKVSPWVTNFPHRIEFIFVDGLKLLAKYV